MEAEGVTFTEDGCAERTHRVTWDVLLSAFVSLQNDAKRIKVIIKLRGRHTRREGSIKSVSPPRSTSNTESCVPFSKAGLQSTVGGPQAVSNSHSASHSFDLDSARSGQEFRREWIAYAWSLS
jgi:hypothetical protein